MGFCDHVGAKESGGHEGFRILDFGLRILVVNNEKDAKDRVLKSRRRGGAE